jgi:hypothetical protein
MGRWKYSVTVAVLAALVTFWLGAPVNAESLEFYQLDFNLDGTITENSDWGAVDLTFTGSASILYFNLTVDGSWQVQNVPVFSIEGVDVTQTQSFWFDLGNEVGEDVGSLYYAYQLTTDTLGFPPNDSVLASVSDRWIIFYNGIIDDPGDPVPPPAGPMVGGLVEGKPSCVNLGVPNQEQGINECAPAAASNSLKWLNATHGLRMPANAIDIAAMKKACGWTAGGCPYTWGTLKDAYLRANGYPITTRIFNANQIGQICAEMDRNQDVEMTVTGHAVTVVGLAQLADGRWIIIFKDDQKQGQKTGLRTGISIYDPTTGKITAGDLKGRTLHHFVVECPLPKPPGNNFGLFPVDMIPPPETEEPIYVVEYKTPSPDTGDWQDHNYNGILDSCDYIKVHWVRPSEDYCTYDWLHIVGEHIVNLDRIVDDGDGIWSPCDSVYKHFKTPPYTSHTYRYHVERVGKWRGLWVVKQAYDPRVYEIPTLTEWGLIILGVLLLGFITWVFLRRRRAVVCQ